MNTLKELIKTLEKRKNEDPNTSYTSYLLNEGIEECGKKFGEESIELIIASLNNKKNVKNEAADVLYHLIVLLMSVEVEFDEVLKIIKKRCGTSGIEEKKSRYKSKL